MALFDRRRDYFFARFRPAHIQNSDNQLQLVIYVGSEDGDLYAVNAASGTEFVALTAWSPAYSSPAVSGDGTIYFGADNGILYAVNPDSSGKWMFVTSGNIVAPRSPAIARSTRAPMMAICTRSIPMAARSGYTRSAARFTPRPRSAPTALFTSRANRK